MKEAIIKIIIGILLFFAIMLFLTAIFEAIGRAVVYGNEDSQRQMEYCISQQKSYEDCWLSVYRSYDYKKQ